MASIPSNLWDVRFRGKSQFREYGLRYVGGAHPMNNDKWEELYLVAAMEVDGKKMLERIATVRKAIRGRLQDLMQSSDHHAERQKMETALKSLVRLEADSREW